MPGFVSFARFVLPILVFGYLLFSALGPVPGRALRAASQVRHLRLWLYLLLVALYLFVGFRIFPSFLSNLAVQILSLPLSGITMKSSSSIITECG